MPLAPLLLALTVLLALPVSSETVARTVYVMGTVLHAEAEASSAVTAAEALEAAIGEVERVEDLLSTWNPATPLSLVNRSPAGTPFQVPAELHALLTEAGAWARRTGWAFDPAVGPLADAWDLRGAGRTPSPEQLAEALSRADPGAFVLDPVTGTVTRRIDGAWLDSGAFGKGAALRGAADMLRSRGARRALLDLGGQVLALASPGADAWEVAVAHPIRREEPVAWLRLRDVSAATSGNSERGLVVDGVRVGHLLDPRTGLPASDFGAVTVVSADPLEADILSTALYVMGPNAGLAWAEGLPDVGVLFLVVDGDGVKTLHNQAMERWLIQPPAPPGELDPSSPERRIP